MKAELNILNSIRRKPCHIMKRPNSLKTKTNIRPKTAVVLGSGLSELIDMAEVDTIIPYSEIPGFPELNNTYHKCRSVFWKTSGKKIY